MKNILIIEDEKDMRKIIKDYLIKNTYNVYEAEDGEEALNIFFEKNIDLLILDIMIPKIDGWEVCKRIRKESKIPIIMLTAKSEEHDEVYGLDIGADEYITKPFSPKILIARVNSLLRRVYDDIGKDELVFNNLKINLKQHRVYFNEKILELTPTEYNLLIYLIQNKGIALSRDVILNKVWGYSYFGDIRTVDTHIKRLRKKLENKFIKTIRGIGYRFEVENENI